MPAGIVQFTKNIAINMSESESDSSLSCDFFNLHSDKSDDELSKQTENELEKIKNYFEVQENAEILSPAISGPCKPNSKQTFNSKTEKETSNITLGSDVPHQAAKKARIDPQSSKDTQNSSNWFYSKVVDTSNLSSSLPKHQVHNFRAHEKTVSSVSWAPSNYSHLLLSSSLDSSLKIWDIHLGKQVQILSSTAAIKDAKFMLCGSKAVLGGFNKKAQCVDICTGDVVFTGLHQNFVTCVQPCGENPNCFFSGSKNLVGLWDLRCPEEPVQKFSYRCGDILCVLELLDNNEIVVSTDLVNRQSAETTIMVWDVKSGALLSNQVYKEHYTCPSLKLEPQHKQTFIAQTNGDYIALFDSCRPYKMNRRKRYEGHKVSGYKVGCDFSPDGEIIVSGDAEGVLHFYNGRTSRIIKILATNVNNCPVLNAEWHPVESSMLACGLWNGNLQIWR